MNQLNFLSLWKASKLFLHQRMIKVDFTLNYRFLWALAEDLSRTLCLCEFSDRRNLLHLFIKMITGVPLKNSGILLSTETSQRENVPIHAVFFDSIPSGTLTPVKDLVKYQNCVLKLNNHKTNQFLETTISKNKNVFQSTMLTEATTSDSLLDISAIKPNKDGLKNKAKYESPGKVFQRMKEKVLHNKQEQASRNSGVLEPQKSERNKMFTPKGAVKRVLQHTYLCEEKENNQSFQSENSSLRGYFYYVYLCIFIMRLFKKLCCLLCPVLF